ncbi:MAG TPA: L-seryl-tRNA(Sec) selenium transferase [Solirubrobacteraceae bacterium]|jgi:L-seryl-tRNA(Ser) seleniumtransferase|nr:L-seryl-tRNA(Sec) selenium transferase [Solirubrobacteraceae bacterium]
MIDPSIGERLRALPAVDRLAAQLIESERNGEIELADATAAARAALDTRRDELLAGVDAGDVDLVARALLHLHAGPRRVLNGTGIIIHTNLGRAPLPEAAVAAVDAAARGYVDLEFDLTTGGRGARDASVAALLRELTRAEDALVVNNCAAATLLAAAALAGPGRAIVVSRGQLVEIGGGFRVPDVVAQAGARLVEVGTTNRTRIDDYRAALDDGAEVILRVHQSNFRTVGFVEEVGIEMLCQLGVPTIDDLGSGVMLAGLDALLADEPPVRASISAGAALVCFSGDKLLGGPQAGILVGSKEAIAACRRHPLARALRVGRLPLAALAATLALYRDPARAVREIPVLAMLTADARALLRRARRLADATGGEVTEAVARAGGGALPLLELRGPAVAIEAGADGADALAARLRAHDPPLIARIADGRVVVDPRTLQGDEELDQAAAAINAAISAA